MLGARTAPARQFIFANLIDTDMLYGHRRDARGFRDAVSAIDSVVGPVLKTL